MKQNKILLFALPLMIILFFLLLHKYGYLGIRSDLAALREERSVKVKLLQKYMDLIAEKPKIEKQIGLLKAERTSDDLKLIEGQTPSLAAATLQDIVKSTVTGNGGTILSERVGKPEDLGKFKVISVSIDTVLPNSGALSNVLYSIESRTPYLIVKEIDIRVQNFVDPRQVFLKLDVAALTGGR